MNYIYINETYYTLLIEFTYLTYMLIYLNIMIRNSTEATCLKPCNLRTF